MHGMIIQQLQQFIIQTNDFTTWKEVVKNAGLENKLFLPTQNYPDDEVQNLITSFAKLKNLSSENVLDIFGSFLAANLMKIYAYSIKPEWKTLDLIEHTENTMHKAVRFNDKTASPPALVCIRNSPTKVTIDYSSKRNMVELGVGIIKGIATHYGEKVRIYVTTKANGGKIVEVVQVNG